jgi:hemerythrin-like domain-containing protein
MRWEHDEIRSTLNRILGQSDADQIRRDILHFLEIVHAHFAKEEQVLFPLVEQLGPHDLAERLSQDYKTARGLSDP